VSAAKLQFNSNYSVFVQRKITRHQRVCGEQSTSPDSGLTSSANGTVFRSYCACRF